MRTQTGACGLAALALLTLAADPLSVGRASGCEEMTGHAVVQDTGDVTVGQMTGSIAGYYEYTLETAVDAGIPGLSIWYVSGTSFVDTAEGTLLFQEAAAMDLAEQVYSNTADLLTITGGTGVWANATGHLILSGFFHTDSGSGEFDYRGEVCRGPVSHEGESWGAVKGRFHQ